MNAFTAIFEQAAGALVAAGGSTIVTSIVRDLATFERTAKLFAGADPIAVDDLEERDGRLVIPAFCVAGSIITTLAVGRELERVLVCGAVTDTPQSPEILTAPLVIEYPFKRTTGPVIGAFLTGLRERILLGSRAEDGRVIVPPAEFDPTSGEDLTELVEVGPAGEVTTWAWVVEPHDKHPLDKPFAWALIKPDGADTPMLGAVQAAAMNDVTTGMRVQPVWADEREGHIADITHWIAAEGAVNEENS